MAALSELYGEPQPQPHGDPLAELVLTVLSQNTSDRNSGRAFVQLMRHYEHWQAMAEAPVEELGRDDPGGWPRSAEGAADQTDPRDCS